MFTTSPFPNPFPAVSAKGFAFAEFIAVFIFSLIVFVGFAPIFWDGFSWSILQCATCAITGAVAELIMEIVFSPIGYRITKKWKADNVGCEYFEYVERKLQ